MLSKNPRMTKLIKQKTPKDCWPTCLAMALNITHSEMKRKIGSTLWKQVCQLGTTFEIEKKLMAKFDLAWEHDWWSLWPDNNHVSTYFLRHVLWGRRAIISVKSKNNLDGMHAIYWNGKELFDPSPKKTYRWEEVEACKFVFFNEQNLE